MNRRDARVSRLKRCERCGKEKVRCLDFERWDSLCRTCRPEHDREREAWAGLNGRDRKILNLAGQGLNTVQIAARLSDQRPKPAWVTRRLRELSDKGFRVGA